MRILIGYRYGVVGGVCTQLFNRMKHVGGLEGVDVTFFFVRDYGAQAMLESYGRVVVGEPEVMKSLLQRERFDVVDIIDTPELLDVALAVDPSRVVVEVHTTYEVALEYLRDCAARRFIVPSQYSRRLLVEEFGVSESNVEVVSNCVDASLFAVDGAAPLERTIVSWVGKLDEHKNWPAFVELAGLVAAGERDVEFWMIGGEGSSQLAKAALLEMVSGYGLDGRLRWFSHLDYAAMPKLHAAVGASGGVNVVTSRDESFGMSVAEALLAGCPVVAPRVGALSELWDGPALRLYAANDQGAAGRAIRRALRDDGVARRVLLDARPTLAERWAPPRAGEAWLTALRT